MQKSGKLFKISKIQLKSEIEPFIVNEEKFKGAQLLLIMEPCKIKHQGRHIIVRQLQSTNLAATVQ